MSEKVSTGRGFAVFSMILGILSCHNAIAYIFYFISFIFSALIDSIIEPATSANAFDEKFWIMEIGCFVFIIIAAALSIVFSVIASNKGSKAKMKNAGIVLSSIALSVSTVIFLLLNL